MVSQSDNMKQISQFIFFFFIGVFTQAQSDNSLLNIDRLYSDEFEEERMPAYQWISKGDAYIILEPSEEVEGKDLVAYETADGTRSIYVSAQNLIPSGEDKPLKVSSFTLSDDESKVLLFTNTARVWRSNTRGDYWVYDRNSDNLRKLGEGLPSRSLMFAKFSADNRQLAYVSNFNLYTEDYETGNIKRLTQSKSKSIINGTFDWVYEEEFGCRDGFRWSPNGQMIAYWQLDASSIGTHYMINNTDSIYAELIPIQYPKVGEDPSSCRVGIINVDRETTQWIDVPGSAVQNYIPRMQWIRDDLLLIQQINRKQNHLIYWNYNPKTKELTKVYEEREDTWVDIDYPDVSSSSWGMYDLSLIEGVWVTRMTETDGWRHVYKINLETGDKVLLTPDNSDVATVYGNDGTFVYYSASPNNSTQRYLWKVNLNGDGVSRRVTPRKYPGINTYDVSPNGQFAFHSHTNAQTARSTHLIRTDGHELIRTFVSNTAYANKVAQLALGDVRFFEVTTEDGITIDGRMVLPPDFDESKKYPVLFHVYGEPWGQVAQDSWIGLWDRYVAQQGYVIIDMDNRGTPCLKGSEWRKSIYRQIGRINANDQAAAARAALAKFEFIDRERTAVWGWSGGGSMTLNLMFRFPDLYTTGISVAPVGNQLLYDNIYQERYMGLPQENREDFLAGSPVTYANQLEGNLLLVHGTADDNVHYQNAEVIINELIKHNRPFDMMSYPNRSHGIHEGENTRKHLYSLITRYLNEHVEPGPKAIEIRP